MGKPDFDLNRLLRQAYPSVEVSPDFSLRLWRRIGDQSHRPFQLVPLPVVGLAAAAGVMLGLWNWTAYLQPSMDQGSLSVVGRPLRMDLFGNAPMDSLAGAYLRFAEMSEKRS